MKQKFFITLFVLILPIFAGYAQLTVTSFKLKPADKTASSKGTEFITNNTKAALIKVVTQENGFYFHGASSIYSVIQKKGEYWVYCDIPYAHFSISHPLYGEISRYDTPQLKSGCTYEMRLNSPHTYKPQFNVTSFELNSTDLTALTEGTMQRDMDGNRTGLIKIITNEKELEVKGDFWGLCGTIKKDGEFWVYVPRQAKALTIRHPVYGDLYNYYYPCEILPGGTYEMTLSFDSDKNTIANSNNSITQNTTATTQPKQEPKVEKIVEPKTVQQMAATPAPKQEPKEMIANVDKNIPESGQIDKNTFVVVIGNEKYEDEADVPFAENDARIFAEYCKKTLGISEKHIRSYVNAGYNDIRKAVSWLKQGLSAYEGEGRAIFYYAGHGIPNEADKSAYLLPVDGVGSDIESAYSLNKLYQSLSELPAKSVLVFLDACFSGAKREGGMMASARGVAIKTKAEEAKGKMVIFSAAQGDETAYPFKSQQHGMFTYYLLKMLSDTKGHVTLGELSDFLRKEVKRESFDENNKMQTPTVNASSALANSWRSMKLR